MEEESRMDEEQVYASIPTDSELAFLHLEKYFKHVLDLQIDRAGNDGPGNVVYVEYIGKVLAAITELGLETAVVKQTVPAIEDVTYQTYQNFSKDVEHYKTALKIRNARRMQGYSVQLDTVTRAKITHHIQQLRDIFQKLEIDVEKKEALLKILNELQKEVDRNRTRFDIFASLVMAVADTAGEAIERSQVRPLLDSIARVIWGVKKDEETKMLPPRAEPKQIEPPRAPKSRDMDDEIPF
jgi:uncharacterized coiled-coil DUF342 family protein